MFSASVPRLYWIMKPHQQSTDFTDQSKGKTLNYSDNTSPYSGEFEAGRYEKSRVLMHRSLRAGCGSPDAPL